MWPLPASSLCSKTHANSLTIIPSKPTSKFLFICTSSVEALTKIHCVPYLFFPVRDFPFVRVRSIRNYCTKTERLCRKYFKCGCLDWVSSVYHYDLRSVAKDVAILFGFEIVAIENGYLLCEESGNGEPLKKQQKKLLLVDNRITVTTSVYCLIFSSFYKCFILCRSLSAFFPVYVTRVWTHFATHS